MPASAPSQAPRAAFASAASRLSVPHMDTAVSQAPRRLHPEIDPGFASVVADDTIDRPARWAKTATVQLLREPGRTH
jgi:hypothetical protein